VTERPSPNRHVLIFKSAGSPFVALLPHVRDVQAAKLTIRASYW
jgi:hypothetical protein